MPSSNVELNEFEDIVDSSETGTTSSEAKPSTGCKNDGRTSEAAALKKRKMSRACDPCRKRKVRCDFVHLPSGDMESCLNCFSSNTKCVFTEDHKLRKTSNRYVRAIEKKVERAERLLELLCPDSELRKGMMEAELDELNSGSLTATNPPLSVASSSLPPVDRSVEPLACYFPKTARKAPIDLMVMGMRVQMFKRYPPEHDEYQDPEDGDIEPDDLAEAEHISQLTYSKMKIEDGDDIMNNTFFLGKSCERTILQQVMTMKEQVYSSGYKSRHSLKASRASPSNSERNVSTNSDAGNGIDMCLANFCHNRGRRSNMDGPHRSRGAVDVDGIDEPFQSNTERLRASFLGKRRPEYWKLRPWEKALFRLPPIQLETGSSWFEFPEPNLLKSLVDCYFKYINVELPLFHRPTFERELAEELHMRSATFGATVLLVCAIGSRYSEDPRVQLSEEEANGDYGERGPEPSRHDDAAEDGSSQRRRKRKVLATHSKGWKYFEIAWNARKSHVAFAPATLYDLQYHCLATQYLRGSTTSWLMVGIGIRLAQDVGAHRRRKLKLHPDMEPELVLQDELWKRAMWVLVALDRFLSASTGRPCALQDEDFDLELPIACDDEYWDHPYPEQRFKQPEDKPSLLTSFTLAIQLNQILAICLRSIYSIKKSKFLMGLAQEKWESQVVSEIDSALNKWFDTVPPHLRWDPKQPNEEFFMQSVMLHSAYYHTQILLHRPFIPAPNRPATVPFPSLAICTNAARSLIHIGLAQLGRTGEISTNMPVHVTSGAVVLLLNMWESRRQGKLTEQRYKIDMEDINGCLEILKSAEKRWVSSGKLWDLVHGLATVNELYVPASTSHLKSTSRQEKVSQDHDGLEKDNHSSAGKLSLASYTSSPFASSPSQAEGRPETPSGLAGIFPASMVASPSTHTVMDSATSQSGWSVFASRPMSSHPWDPQEEIPAYAPYDLDHLNTHSLSVFEGSLLFQGLGEGLVNHHDTNSAEDFEMSSLVIPPSLWPDGSVPHFDDWGSYLTGIADLTSQYDLLFPHEPLMHTEPPQVFSDSGARGSER